MKNMKKILALLVAVLMIAASVSAFAATQTKALSPADADNATVTVNNPAKGETYNLFKLFDATVSESGEISYQCTGDIPSELTSFFSKDASNNVIPADSILEKDNDGKVTGSKMTEDLKAALETWAGKQEAMLSEKSDGKEALAFTSLPYGYYVVTTSHKPDGENAKAAITVTSTKPSASIWDKNSNEPKITKTVEHETYTIGDTVKYTATFPTTNYLGEGTAAKQVVEYVVTDTLPAFLSDAKVTKIMIGETEYKVENAVPQFVNKSITIPWATKDTSVTPAKFTSLYDQGTTVTIEYEAKLTSTTNINKADKNVITLTANVDNDNGDKQPWDDSWKDDAEIITYAAAIKKVDEEGKPLDGAIFTIKGLTVAADEANPGVYTVVSYDPTSDTQSAELSTDDQGKLYIVGLASNVSLTVTEFKAPDGYNKLTETKTLTPQVLSKQLWKKNGYEKYDADGNLIEFKEEETTEYIPVTKNLKDLDAAALKIQNNKGVELPSTGGIGTTLFYIGGGILVLAAVILLVTKRRMNAND